MTRATTLEPPVGITRSRGKAKAVFDAWFVWVAEMVTARMALDVDGNVSFFLMGLFGWGLMRGETERI